MSVRQARQLRAVSVAATDVAADYIAITQRASGEIPWFDGGKTDPWDHVEAAMGLSIGGYSGHARRAFEWSANMQLEDGSWYSAYKNGVPEDFTRDANMSSYIAVGVYHYFLIFRDKAFLKQMWDTVARAIGFVIGLQAKGGEIYWAVSPEGNVDKMALLTGSSSVYMSIKCALAIADILGYDMPEWKHALSKLEYAIRERRHIFNVTKARFSMDWFYPILCGAIIGDAAKRRIEKYWKKFIIEGQGVRCVSDQPWVTIAESSELCMALSAMGNKFQSEIVFDWIWDKRYEDDSTFWCGHTYPDMVVWPEEKNTWTNAAAMMAADAIYGITPASKLFSHEFWKEKRS